MGKLNTNTNTNTNTNATEEADKAAADKAAADKAAAASREIVMINAINRAIRSAKGGARVKGWTRVAAEIWEAAAEGGMLPTEFFRTLAQLAPTDDRSLATRQEHVEEAGFSMRK